MTQEAGDSAPGAADGVRQRPLVLGCTPLSEAAGQAYPQGQAACRGRYSNSMRQRTSAPRLPSDELEMSMTLSYQNGFVTRPATDA